MVLVENFFCFELFTTGLVLGWLGLAESISSFIASILIIVHIDTVIPPEELQPMIISIMGINVASNLIGIPASGLLIAGTRKRNHLLLLPWLIKGAISVLLMMSGIIIAIAGELSSKTANYAFCIPFLVVCLTAFGIYLYAWIAIYSLYDVFRRSQPNNEYSNLIADDDANGDPIYTCS